jgi:hypothetical protein
MAAWAWGATWDTNADEKGDVPLGRRMQRFSVALHHQSLQQNMLLPLYMALATVAIKYRVATTAAM